MTGAIGYPAKSEVVQGWFTFCRRALWCMGDYHVDGPNTPCVRSPEEMAGRFQAGIDDGFVGMEGAVGGRTVRTIW